MYAFEITSTQILFRAKWLNKKGFRETSCPRPPFMTFERLTLICEQTMEMCQRGTRYTATHFFMIFKHIVRFAMHNKSDFPAPGHSDWKVFIHEHFIFHLSHPEKLSGTGDKERVSMQAQWRHAHEFYERLKQKQIVPYNVDIPRIRKLTRPDECGSEDILDSVQETYSTVGSASELWPKTFLIDKDLNTPTDKFLANLQSQLVRRSEGIISACQSYWDKVVECQAIGAGLIESISKTRLLEVLDSGVFEVNGVHLAHPDSPEGLAWFLAVIDYCFQESHELEFISYELMTEIPFLRQICNNPNLLAQMTDRIKAIAGENGAPLTRVNETLNRLLGHISARDCAAAAAIIIADNPKFTPTALREADYLSADDKPLHHYNSELGCMMWSVSKPRARDRKVSALSPRSAKAYAQVVRATLKSRWKLMSKGDPNYRKLFLTSTFKWVGMSTAIGPAFAGELGVSLFDALEPELVEAGVSRKSFGLKRIRGTQGMIAFLKEGTYQSVANKLGNSIAVVKVHYVPSWLKRRWNVRILRIFQTKLVVLATKNKPWAVEASDFLNKEDLFKFVINAAQATEGRDPISISLRRYAAQLTEDAAEFVIEPLLLHKMMLKLDANVFAAIFMFAEMHLLPLATEERYDDLISGLSEDSLVTLSRLLHASYEASIEETKLSPALQNITGFSLPKFQTTYLEALQIKAKLSGKISSAEVLAA
ncbi:hypothetical protein A8L59_17960 [Pseudomonas koreensis]|uniref:Uncharacterized protein n=1 Tax=Pseudomonas koreensis TaxID=198620 RepID=A0AAC9FXH4_9PSED|nr:hypothetical protein [Pseudomonas koreensis]ANH99214.1 hypothetical protein A8L59_17960 [Pseudomonas koreensis]